MNDGVWLGEQIIPVSYVQAIKNITTSSIVAEPPFNGSISYGLKFWSIYASNTCGVGGNEKCLAENTVITPQGFDGQWT